MSHVVHRTKQSELAAQTRAILRTRVSETISSEEREQRALDQAHAAKDIGRLCFYLVFVWAEHRKILPYEKSDRQ